MKKIITAVLFAALLLTAAGCTDGKNKNITEGSGNVANDTNRDTNSPAENIQNGTNQAAENIQNGADNLAQDVEQGAADLGNDIRDGLDTAYPDNGTHPGETLPNDNGNGTATGHVPANDINKPANDTANTLP